LHDHIYLTRQHHAKRFNTFTLAINFSRMGCPTCGCLGYSEIDEEPSLFGGDSVAYDILINQAFRRLDNLRYVPCAVKPSATRSSVHDPMARDIL
jgi:hypothetical protein